MNKHIFNSISSFKFYDKFLYGRTLRSHLKQSYLLCDKLNCSKMECIVALYHSFYGYLFGYDSVGQKHLTTTAILIQIDRKFLKSLIDNEIEELIYLYNIIQAKQGFYTNVKISKCLRLLKIDSLIGQIDLSRDPFQVVVNV